MGQLYKTEKSKLKNRNKVGYKFATGGRVYRSFPEYDKAMEVYQQEKKKAENYNSLEAELYGLSGQTQGNTENYKQLGDMFNSLSPAQQDAMAAKYKAEFVTNVPSAQRRNYINSMEMTVPGKGTGYYSFPSNATVYGTQVLEKPLMQMDRMQMSQVKPVQQLSDGFKPSMNQRISMPGMRMPVSQSTQSMSQPTKGYTSVVDLLNSRKMDSSFASRKKMAEERGIKNYTGSSMQNKELNSRLMNEQFGNGGNLTMYGFGGPTKPTASDSLAVMNSQIALNKFYENEVKQGRMKKNKREFPVDENYLKRSLKTLNDENLKFYRDQIAYREKWKRGQEDVPYESNFNLKSSDVSKLEYQGLGKTKSGDANKQYYRDLITPMQNLVAPFALVDSRIKPRAEISYTGLGSYPGGAVRVYDYDPIAVKPAAMKTAADWAHMKKTYGTKPPVITTPKPTTTKTVNTTKDKVTNPVRTKDNLERMEMTPMRPLDIPIGAPHGELLPIPPKQTVNLGNLTGTHPVQIYDRRGNFLRTEYTGDADGVVDFHYAGDRKYSHRGGTGYLDLNAPIKEVEKRSYGGDLTMYGPGGQLPPKEYTSLKDFQKAEKLYTDSLTTYNNSSIRRAEIIQNYKNAKSKKELDEANNKTKAKYPLNENIAIKDKSEIIFKRKLPDGTTANLVSSRHFKKPVQPVVYRPPAKHVQKLNEKLMKPFYSYGVKPTTSLERMEIIPHTLDNPKVIPHGELIPITPMTLPQQGNTPFYGPGGTTVGYTNEKMEFYPAQKYTGAPNNPLNLQDKELLDNPEMLKKYALSKDNYKFSYGGKLSGKYLKMLAYGGDFLDQPNLGEDREEEIDYTKRGETTLESLNVAPYQLPTTKSLVGKPTGTPIAMPTGQTATVNLGETTEDGLGLKKALGADKISENGVNALNAGIQLGTSFLASQMERKKNPNSTYTYDGQNRTVEGAKGLSTGFALGNKVLPGVGGVVGAFAGGIYGIAKGSKMDKQAKLDRGYQDQMFKRSRDLEMEGRQRLQGEQQYGRNTQMYADGGSLSAKFLAGLNPNVSQTSSSTTEIHGKSHENGGVPLKNMNAEVEAGETTAGDYVFSKRLGFAAVHKPIAKAKGLIEGKPATKERLNSLKLLQEKENKLSLAQEYIKNTLNLQ